AGLTITGSGVTIRGLDIVGFASGAGILITGPGASHNAISANVIGTDPTGSIARPNQDGVRIQAGAHDNTVGGTTAGDGNVIADNHGSGVVVTGDASLGIRINANRIFANQAIVTPTPAGALAFRFSTYVTLPDNMIRGFEQAETIEAWFQTTSSGVIL